MRYIVAVLCFLLMAASAFAQSPPQQRPILTPPTNNQQQPHTDQRGTDKSPLIVKIQNPQKSDAEAERHARRAADHRMFVVGIAAIIVGGAQAFFLFITFLIISWVGINELRAYVFADVMGVKKFSLTEPIEVTVVWKNCGKTPAKYFESHGIVWIAELPMPDETQFEPGRAKESPDLGRHSKPTAYPGAEQRADYASVERPIPPAVLEAIIAGKFAIYVVGEAFYRDVFRWPRKTQFCRYIDPEDAIVLIRAERENLPLKDFEVKFGASHVLNDFT